MRVAGSVGEVACRRVLRGARVDWSGSASPGQTGARGGSSATAIGTSSSTRSALMAMAAADPSPAAVMTWARGLATLPATQTPGTLVRAGGVGDDPAVLVGSAAQARPAGRCCGTKRGGTNTRVARRRCGRRPAATPRQLVVLDDEPGDGSLDDADGAGDELFALVGGQRSPSVRRGRRRRTTAARSARSGPRPGRSTEDAERLVADLLAVAVRAVQHVAAPALAQAGDVGQLVAQPGGDEHPPGAQTRSAVGEQDLEAAPLVAATG